MQDRDALYERCQVWADEFMPAAREEYSGLLSGEIGMKKSPKFAKTFAYAVRIHSRARWMLQSMAKKP